MQSGKIMSQSCIFTLNSGHVGFANNLIFRVNKHFIEPIWYLKKSNKRVQVWDIQVA